MLAAANLQEACVETSQLRAEYHKRAAEARRLAEDAADPEVKVDLIRGGAALVGPGRR
jgi:hypothetical protein